MQCKANTIQMNRFFRYYFFFFANIKMEIICVKWDSWWKLWRSQSDDRSWVLTLSLVHDLSRSLPLSLPCTLVSSSWRPSWYCLFSGHGVCVCVCVFMWYYGCRIDCQPFTNVRAFWGSWGWIFVLSCCSCLEAALYSVNKNKAVVDFLSRSLLIISYSCTFSNWFVWVCVFRCWPCAIAALRIDSFFAETKKPVSLESLLLLLQSLH